MNACSCRAAAVLSLAVSFFAGCGGGDGGRTLTFTVIGVNPNVSDDLNGGDIVTVIGTNFLTVQVVIVTFGGSPGTDLELLGETSLRVRTPPAPGGAPGTVTVEVTSLLAGKKALFNAYTYRDAAVPPNPQTIIPTSFTATGAEDFTISGTNLGPPGGQVTVIFQGVGSVVGAVSGNAQFVQGRAPVAPAAPPSGSVTVTVDTGSFQADVPTSVTYSYAAPTSLQIPGQTPGNASEPVRLADGHAVLAIAGPDGAWGNADDQAVIVKGPPNAPSFAPVLRRGSVLGVGNLSASNSIPAILGPDTFCVYTLGADATPGTFDDSFVLVTNARTAPVADEYVFGWFNAAPVAAVGSNRVAFVNAGLDRALGTPDDALLVVTFNLGATPPAPGAPAIVAFGYADPTPGPANFSIPFSADGDTVFVLSVGPNGTAGDADDFFATVQASTLATVTPVPAPRLQGRPVALSATLLAAPGAGPNGVFGGATADDTLDVFSKAGAAWTVTRHMIGRPLNVPAVVPYARVGGGIVLPVTGPNAIVVYSNPLAGTNASLPMPGMPLFAPLGSGALAVFGPGPDLTPRAGGDDQALYIPAAGTSSQTFSLPPNLPQNLPALSDADRAFGLSPGGDNVFRTPDDLLEVFQSRALGAAVSVSRLPAGGAVSAPLTGAEAFVPVGPGWGLVQSPGANGTYGDPDDRVVLVRY